MNRLQEQALEAFSLRHGGQPVAVREGFADGHVDLTLEGGAAFFLADDGGIVVKRDDQPNHSIDWSNHA